MAELIKEKMTFLKEPFENWYETQIRELWSITSDGYQPDFHLLNKLNLSVEEFTNTYLKPYEKLDIKTIKAIQLEQTKFCYNETKNPITFKYNYEHKEKEYALSWILSNVVELKLFRLDVTEPYYSEPYKQCKFCGKLIHDERGKKFNKSLQYCHTIKCEEEKQKRKKSPEKYKLTSNPAIHVAHGCCYGKWAFLRKKIVKQIRQEKNRDEKIKIFFNFIEERLDFYKNQKQKCYINYRFHNGNEWGYIKGCKVLDEHYTFEERVRFFEELQFGKTIPTNSVNTDKPLIE